MSERDRVQRVNMWFSPRQMDDLLRHADDHGVAAVRPSGIARSKGGRASEMVRHMIAAMNDMEAHAVEEGTGDTPPGSQDASA